VQLARRDYHAATGRPARSEPINAKDVAGMPPAPGRPSTATGKER
jgi:hypothetical protein